MNNFNPFGQGNNSQPPQDSEERKATAAVIMGGVKRRLIVLAVIVLVGIFLSQCLVVTMADEYIVIQQFGEIKNVTYEPGISFKLPFIQTVRSVPKMMMLYDIPISDVFTQDKKTMVVDSFVMWKVEDPIRFIRSVNGNVTVAEEAINTNTYNAMKNVINMLPQSEIISDRDKLAHQIVANIDTSLQDEYGVEVVAVETKHLDLPDENKQAVYTRMISERNNIAASYSAEGEEEARKIRTETDKTVSIMLSQANAKASETIAEGERRYMELLAQTYNDPQKAEFYGFVRALDASKEALRNGNTTLILSSDSPIAQIFYNIQ